MSTENKESLREQSIRIKKKVNTELEKSLDFLLKPGPDKLKENPHVTADQWLNVGQGLKNKVEILKTMKETISE